MFMNVKWEVYFDINVVRFGGISIVYHHFVGYEVSNLFSIDIFCISLGLHSKIGLFVP